MFYLCEPKSYDYQIEFVTSYFVCNVDFYFVSFFWLSHNRLNSVDFYEHTARAIPRHAHGRMLKFSLLEVYGSITHTSACRLILQVVAIAMLKTRLF